MCIGIGEVMNGNIVLMPDIMDIVMKRSTPAHLAAHYAMVMGVGFRIL